VPSWYATPNDELAALARACSRVGCQVVSLAIGPTPDGPHAIGQIECRTGWRAARLLVALMVEDAKSPGGRRLAAELRRVAPGDGDYARLVQTFVKKRVRFQRERGEVFTGGGYTLAVGFGDCDDHARLVGALGLAGGLPAKLAFLHAGGPPKHVLAQLGVAGIWEWAETTIDARFGENPLAAVDRLGIAQGRTDIAREVVTMSDQDLNAPPPDYVSKNPPEQVKLDAEALSRLGYLAACETLAEGDPADMNFRRAVLALQVAAGITADGLDGAQTRGAIAALLPVDEFGQGYRQAIGAVDAPAAPSDGMSHSVALAIVRDSLRRITGAEPSDASVHGAASVGWLETRYGRSGQFGKLAAQGQFNWGAVERAKLHDGSCPEGYVPGTDVGHVCFRVWPTDDAAADDYIKILINSHVPLDQGARAQAAAMRRAGYYGGFHWAPGYNEMIKGDPRGIEMATPAEADAANVNEYASAIQSAMNVYASGKDAKTSGIAAVRAGGAIASLGVLLAVGAALGAAAVAGWKHFA
jgi:hypothetical protein